MQFLQGHQCCRLCALFWGQFLIAALINVCLHVLVPLGGWTRHGYARVWVERQQHPSIQNDKGQLAEMVPFHFNQLDDGVLDSSLLYGDSDINTQTDIAHELIDLLTPNMFSYLCQCPFLRFIHWFRHFRIARKARRARQTAGRVAT